MVAVSLKKKKKKKRKEKGLRKTKQDANKQLEEIVHKMYEDGLGLEQISAYCSLNVDEIELLIKS